MKTAKWLNVFLWLVNLSLGVGILVFVYENLIARELVKHEEEMGFQIIPATAYQSQPEEVKEDLSVYLRALPNPLERDQPQERANPGVVEIRGVTLKATFPSREPSRASAILEIQSRNQQVVAFHGEEVKGDGVNGEDPQPVAELRGWTLAEVESNRVVFQSGGKTCELKMSSEELEGAPVGMMNPGGRPGVPRPGAGNQPYNAANFKSFQERMSENEVVWSMDPAEVEYAMGSQDSILKDAELTPFSGGGVKIARIREGSIGRARGIQNGDVVQSINGQPINSLADFQNLAQAGGLQQSNSLRLQVLRGDRMVSFEFKMGQR